MSQEERTKKSVNAYKKQWKWIRRVQEEHDISSQYGALEKIHEKFKQLEQENRDLREKLEDRK